MNPKSNNSKLETLFLKIFRYTVLTGMTIAIVALPILLLGAAFMYFQSPSAPLSIESSVNKDLSVESLKQTLIDIQKSKDANSENKAPKPTAPQPSNVLQYNEQALAIYKCGDELKRASGSTVEMTDSAQLAQQVEQIRSHIERLAADPQKGLPYANGISSFACKVLSDPAIAALKKEGKIGQVIIPTLNIYTKAWDDAERKADVYKAAELVRVIQSKKIAIELLLSALYLFGAFMLLALYLIVSRVENHFTSINESIINVGEILRNK